MSYREVIVVKQEGTVMKAHLKTDSSLSATGETESEAIMNLLDVLRGDKKSGNIHDYRIHSGEED